MDPASLCQPGQDGIPKGYRTGFREHFKENVWVVEGNRIAKTFGNIQVANIVMIGALSNFFSELNQQQWIDAIQELLPAKLHGINVKAFHAGHRSKNLGNSVLISQSQSKVARQKPISTAIPIAIPIPIPNF